MTPSASYRIAVIPGDGTGPEVTREALKALEAAAARERLRLELHPYDLGGERYLRTGEILPESVFAELSRMDAILLGAIGHPEVKPGLLEKGLLLELRFRLDQYINLRPVVLYPGVETPLKDKGPDEINFVVVRENTEGLYTGGGGFLRRGTPQEVAIQESINTRHGVERCVRYAFDYCRRRGRRKKLTLCGKTNVLTYAFDLWERVFRQVADEYPDVTTDYGHVDAVSMWMIKNPEWFDVIVTDNMFGDIISDIGAIIQGGLGIAAGGNINPQGVSMFEPIGGSAPKYTGQNVINPLACIGAAAMMLDHLGQAAAAARIERAIRKVVAEEIRSLASGKMGKSTTEVGDVVAGAIAAG
jgi:3-isopropylmalate dehydrogenase